MDKIKIGEGEIKLMEIIWDGAPIKAGVLVGFAKEKYGWNPNTSYTMLKRLIDKGVLERKDPGFYVAPLVGRAEVQQQETETLINRLYQGSRKLFLTQFLNHERLSPDEIEKIQNIIDGKK